MAKSNDIQEMQDTQLVDLIKTTRRDLFGLRFQHATGELENTAGLRNSKRALARALTIAHQRGIDTNEI
ncbi:MAG: ribosomal protein [Solirubrobacterales bacterium]|jgi:large subunit ribosomal protein L29|nr:ribosomal protein [Solirubrobacterales bacterium]